MKRVIIVIISLVLALNMVSTVSATTTLESKKCTQVERKIKQRYKNIKIYKSGKKCWNAIDHRKNKSYYIVEKISGKVVNARTGKGKTDTGYYISYRNVKGIRKGSRIVSYLVYRKGNNSHDDIIKRYDVVVKR